MNRPARSIEIFTMSALDLFVTAMGSFAILMMILFPYFHAKKGPKVDKAEIAKSTLLFCVWDTRFKDFEEFAKTTDANTPPDPKDVETREAWKHPGFDPEPDFPVVSVTWDQAASFCKWLTEKERKAGLIGPEDEYRLPTDEEWSMARGPGTVPWGEQWPPPPDAGTYANFAGKEYEEGLGRTESTRTIGAFGFRDAFEIVAPVGSFKPNPYGLFDMAGNVWQFCAGWYRASMNSEEIRKASPYLNNEGDGTKFRFARGGSWQTTAGVEIMAGFRSPMSPGGAWEDTGFRCVLALKSPPNK